DAFLNISDGQAITLAPGTSLDGDEISVNISQVPAGTAARLLLRLVNNDQDTHTGVAVRDLTMSTAGNAPAVTSDFDEPPTITQTADISALEDVTSLVDVEYLQTSSFGNDQQIAATVRLHSRSGGDQPIALAIANLSDPSVLPLG